MSTNRIGLIIQGTLSGLTNLVVSPNMATLIESPVVKPSLLDERNEIAQYARNTNVYSLENNAQLNIFSIILTDKLDSFKRAGYVAIRLYFPNGVISQQPIVQILNQLKDKYEEIAKNNTGNFDMYANQFMEIVAAIQTTNATPTPNLGIHKKACFGFDVNTENVSQKIQTLTAKSYFSKIYGVPTPLLGNLIQNGYTDISNVSFHKVTINGMFQLVQNVTVNNQSIVFDKNNFSLELNVLPSDQILINYKDGRTEQVPPQKGFHNITQKQQPRPHSGNIPKQVGSSKKDNSKNNFLILGGLVVVLSVILIIYWKSGNSEVDGSLDDIKIEQTKTEVNISDSINVKNLEYQLVNDVLECMVDKTIENSYVWRNSDSTRQKNMLKFCLFNNKTIGILKPDGKIVTTNFDLQNIYKNFKLDSIQIKTKMNALIESKKTTVDVKKENNKTQKNTSNNTLNKKNVPSNTSDKKPSSGNTSSGNADEY